MFGKAYFFELQKLFFAHEAKKINETKTKLNLGTKLSRREPSCTSFLRISFFQNRCSHVLHQEFFI